MRETMLVCMIIGVLTACGSASEPGLQGPQGSAGVAGAAAGCHVQQTSEGALISCSDGSSALVLHGKKSCRCKHKHHHRH